MRMARYWKGEGKSCSKVDATSDVDLELLTYGITQLFIEWYLEKKGPY